ncbi:hypothetical protein QYZ88_016040 [Lachnospiraceae bacterium C1.1]|nr:hypothetical protein [Lachnospiraceae bacterium C1.1]
MIVNEDWNDNPIIVNDTVQVVFADDDSGTEQANGFMGIAVSGFEQGN